MCFFVLLFLWIIMFVFVRIFVKLFIHPSCAERKVSLYRKLAFKGKHYLGIRQHCDWFWKDKTSPQTLVCLNRILSSLFHPSRICTSGKSLLFSLSTRTVNSLDKAMIFVWFLDKWQRLVHWGFRKLQVFSCPLAIDPNLFLSTAFMSLTKIIDIVLSPLL